MMFQMLAVTFAAGLWAAPAQAQNNYAVIQIENKTKDITIHYRLRWGTGDWSEEVAIKPGTFWTHWYQFTQADQNECPIPQIRFATGIGRRRTLRTYNLEAYASPTKDTGGMIFQFKKMTDAEGEDYIDLFFLKDQ
jgi:hypothetical protein